MGYRFGSAAVSTVPERTFAPNSVDPHRCLLTVIGIHTTG